MSLTYRLKRTGEINPPCTELQASVHCFIYAPLGFGNDRRVSRAFQWFMYHPLGFLIFRDSKAGLVPSTLGMCRYISHSEIVCRGPKKFENPCSRVIIITAKYVFWRSGFVPRQRQAISFKPAVIFSQHIKYLCWWGLI